MKPMTTPGGRPYTVLGDASVITMDRLPELTARLDEDPRIASVSVVSHPNPGQSFLRATAPAGTAVIVALDTQDLVREISEESAAEELSEWAKQASRRGLWHDWWLTSAVDVAQREDFLAASEVDLAEVRDPASSRNSALDAGPSDRGKLTLTVDVTWLGEHQTGAQVLTTAAIDALARNEEIGGIRLVGQTSLPAYAAHLVESPKVDVLGSDSPVEANDVIWYPNQIDQRVDMSRARSLGRRVVTTYLDLIAYDIPRYHASTRDWIGYRAMQRTIALSVDGITTISADVAKRLLEEVPRLDAQRVQPIPLGLDHITAQGSEPAEDMKDIVDQLGNRPFLLVLGNDFTHKNRDFALKVWERVLGEGVNCDIVLAGLHVRSSSSRSEERTVLDQHTNLRGSAHHIGHVDEASRLWLLEHAAAVVYPSSAEGFGFVPYEAAALGTPATFTRFGPLAEISGLREGPSSWSVDQYATDLVALLSRPEAALQRVNALRQATAALSWDLFASRLVDFMRTIVDMPIVPAALVQGQKAGAGETTGRLSGGRWNGSLRLRRAAKRLLGS